MWPRWHCSPKTESGCEPWSCPCSVSRGWSSCSLSSGNADKRQAGGGLQGRRMSRQAILSTPHHLSAVSVFLSLGSDIIITAPTLDKLFFLSVSFVFFLMGEDWGIRYCFTFVVSLMELMKVNWSVCFMNCRVSHLKEADMQWYALTDMTLWPLTLSAS